MKRLAWVLGMLLLAGCGDRLPAASDLEHYANGLPSMNSVLDEFDMAFISSGAQEDGVYLEIRKRHDPMKSVSEAEIERIRQAVYREYGREFPLRIEVWTMPEQPTLVGSITAIDEQGILVVEPPSDPAAGPKAMWLKTGTDTVMLNPDGTNVRLSDLAVGFRVRAWSEPMIMTSYPEQSGLLRLEVTDADIGEGDLQGTITKIGTETGDDAESELQIDGKAYRVLKSAQIRIGGSAAEFEELKEGDRVSVWFVGYEVMPGDKAITQVVASLPQHD